MISSARDERRYARISDDDRKRPTSRASVTMRRPRPGTVRFRDAPSCPAVTQNLPYRSKRCDLARHSVSLDGNGAAGKPGPGQSSPKRFSTTRQLPQVRRTRRLRMDHDGIAHRGAKHHQAHDRGAADRLPSFRPRPCRKAEPRGSRISRSRAHAAAAIGDRQVREQLKPLLAGFAGNEIYLRPASRAAHCGAKAIAWARAFKPDQLGKSPPR